MPKLVYTFDRTEGLIKIVKHGKRWCIYRVKAIKWWTKHFKNPMRSSEKRYKFSWQDHPVKTWHYKPFEDSDVSNNPEDFIADVKIWQPFIMSYEYGRKNKSR